MGFLEDIKKGITAAPKDKTGSQKTDVSKETNAKEPTDTKEIKPAPPASKPETNLAKEPPINEEDAQGAFSKEELTDISQPINDLKNEENKKEERKRGMHREENIFSFKNDKKENENLIKEEKELFDRVHNTKELASGTEGELPYKSKPVAEGVAEKRGALNQLRAMNEASKKNTINVSEWSHSDDEENHPEKEYSESKIKTVPGKEKQSIDFSWENDSKIEPPKPEDFMASRIRKAGPEIEKNKKEEAEQNVFGWEKENLIDKPKTEDFLPRKIPESEGTPEAGWRNKEEASGKENWFDEEKIEEPRPEDFLKNNDTKKKETINEKEETKKGEETEEASAKDKPAWLRDDIKEEKVDVPEGMESGPKRIHEDIGKEVEKSGKVKEKENKPKKQVDWLEGDFDSTSLEEDVLTEMKKSVGPKWKSKGRTEVKEETIQRRPEALSTPIDKMFDLLTSYKEANSKEIAEYCGLKYDEVEIIARKFEEEGVVEMKYYTTPGKRPSVVLKEDVPSNIREIPQGKIIDKYEMIVDFVPVLITIVEVRGEPRPIYTLGTPSIGKYTRKFLDIVKDEVAETMPIELEEILDPRKSKKLKVRFFKELTKNMGRYLSDVDVDILNPLSGIILHELYGLGDIELFMADDMLEEVAINSAKTPLTVYHRVYGWMKTNVFIDREERIVNYASQIGRKVGREITVLKPILDAHLLSGDRVNATLFPVSSEGNTLTIRRFARRPWTIIDFIGKAHTMNTEMAALLWLGMQYELNILVAGGTASGKTSALNTLLAMVPPYHRLISIEDVREIVLPKYLIWNWVAMVTRSPNPEGLGEVTMLELMHSSLRMRPDRIIVGEIRRHKEAEVLMEAIETGHSIYSTVHANSAYQVLRRLVEPPMNIPPLQVELLDIIIVQYRDRKSNKRRTYEIAEIEQTSSGQGLQVNTIYKWSPRTDNWDKLSKPVKLLTLLNLHTGLTEEDINKELADRKMILEWMRNNNITSLDDIGLVMKIFYSDVDKVKTLARKNVSLEEFKKKV